MSLIFSSVSHKFSPSIVNLRNWSGFHTVGVCMCVTIPLATVWSAFHRSIYRPISPYQIQTNLPGFYIALWVRGAYEFSWSILFMLFSICLSIVRSTLAFHHYYWYSISAATSQHSFSSSPLFCFFFVVMFSEIY